ncbi:MAG: uroporphyrinogen decarboxylase family protein [Anaerolineae bacterium]
MSQMTKWERVEAALHGQEVDRVPIGLWAHYHLQDRAPRRLVEATLNLHRQFDTDLVKLTPSGLYSIQDWGATIRFGLDDDTFPLTVEPVVRTPDQWEELPRLDVRNGALARELETIAHLAEALDGSAPFVMTVFNPLTTAYKLCGDRVSGERVVAHLREAPEQVHAGLRVITDVVREYALACLEAGASGIFFATQLATYDLLTREEYEEFGVPYDLEVLEALQGKSRITMLHVCKQNLMFDLVADYPVHIIHWADRESGPSLAEARRMTRKPLAGGLALKTLREGTEEDVVAEVRDAIAQAGRTGFLVAPACVIRAGTPAANLAAARRAVEETARR